MINAFPINFRCFTTALRVGGNLPVSYRLTKKLLKPADKSKNRPGRKAACGPLANTNLPWHANRVSNCITKLTASVTAIDPTAWAFAERIRQLIRQVFAGDFKPRNHLKRPRHLTE